MKTANNSRLVITPNIAARLQALAEPDTIVISEQTKRLLAGKFELVDGGLQPIKGIRASMRVWTVTGVSDAASRFDAAALSGLSPFVRPRSRHGTHCRQVEITPSVVKGKWCCCRARRGLENHASSKKCVVNLGRAGTYALQLQCSPYHASSAYYPITHAFARVLKFRRKEAAATKLDRLDALLIDRLGCSAQDAALFASMLSIETRCAPMTLPDLPGTAPEKSHHSGADQFRGMHCTARAHAAADRRCALGGPNRHWKY